MNQVYINSVIFAEKIEFSNYNTGLIDDNKNREMNVINLYPEKQYQTIEGFGGALTESAGYAYSKMSNEKKEEIINAYYGKESMNYTFARIPLDSCDFSLNNYCAINNPCDSNFKEFSLARDREYIQPLVRDVSKVLQKKLNILLSPWSPPAFMKDTKIRNGGGHLQEEYYQMYADYIAKYIEEYNKLGFKVNMITIQNEPLAVQLWDSCTYSPEEEKCFLEKHLYPTLQKKGLKDVQIFIWDHNKERVYERTRAIIDDKTKDMVSGVAFHFYTGDHFDTLQMVREDYPNLKLMHSEGCVEFSKSAENYSNDVKHAFLYAHDLIGDLNHGMNSWIDWNIVLDEKGGPNHVGNYCYAPIRCDTKTGLITYKPSYYAIYQFSHYIKPGASRIASSCFTSEIEITAFKNSNGTFGAVISNPKEERTVDVRVENKFCQIKIPATSISTVIIK